MSREFNVNEIFKELFYDYKDDMKRMVLKYCNYNDSLAEDAVQQAYFKLFITMKEEGSGRIESPRAYLFMSARNFLYNYHRDNAKLQFGDKEDVLGVLDEEISSLEEDFMYAERKLAELEILEELKKHNTTWYYALTEVYIKKRTQKEVAQELQISSSCMYAILRRVRKWANDNLQSRGV